MESVTNTQSTRSWFVLGQLFASVALNRLNAKDPLDFRTAIYSQVQTRHQSGFNRPRYAYSFFLPVGYDWSFDHHLSHNP
jgi:hypothetical protein